MLLETIKKDGYRYIWQWQEQTYGEGEDQCEICDVQKLLGMRKMVATFYCHFAIPVLKQEWRRGESGDSRM